MTLNVDLIRDTVAAIEAEPENFDMRGWLEKSDANECGTVMCFAGYALMQSGGYDIGMETWTEEDWVTEQTVEISVPRFRNKVTGQFLKEYLVQDVAQELLGFTGQQASSIFFATSISTAEDLRRRINRDVAQIF